MIVFVHKITYYKLEFFIILFVYETIYSSNNENMMYEDSNKQFSI